MEASILSLSSLHLMRPFVICSAKARLCVLVWGSLDILCNKLITSERVQLSKSISLLSKVVVVCRDPEYAYVIPVTTQSYGESRVVPTCLSRQGQARNTLGKHHT